MKKKILKVMVTGMLVFTSLWGSELVLLDMSGSMGYGNRGDDAKIMVQKLLNQGIRVLGYNNKIREVKSVDDIKYESGSDLGQALEYIYLSERDVKYINLIFDGDVGDKLKTLRFGTFLKNHNVSICSIGVDMTTMPAQVTQISKKALITTDIMKARKMCMGIRKTALNEIIEEIDEDQFNLF